MLVGVEGRGGGVIQLFKLKISPNYFYKGKKCDFFDTIKIYVAIFL